MGNVNWELLDQVLGDASPEEFRGQDEEQIEATIRELNQEWAREGNGLAEDEIAEVVADIYHLANSITISVDEENSAEE